MKAQPREMGKGRPEVLQRGSRSSCLSLVASLLVVSPASTARAESGRGAPGMETDEQEQPPAGGNDHLLSGVECHQGK